MIFDETEALKIYISSRRLSTENFESLIKPSVRGKTILYDKTVKLSILIEKTILKFKLA